MVCGLSDGIFFLPNLLKFWRKGSLITKLWMFTYFLVANWNKLSLKNFFCRFSTANCQVSDGRLLQNTVVLCLLVMKSETVCHYQ